MSHIPLRRRPLEKGRGRVYQDRMSKHWFADFRAADGKLSAVWAADIADGNDWCRGKVATVDNFGKTLFAALDDQRKQERTW